MVIGMAEAQDKGEGGGGSCGGGGVEKPANTNRTVTYMPQTS